VARLQIAWGRQTLDLDVPDRNLVASRRHSAVEPLTDLAGAVRSALEQPLRFPTLRRALTPDDHVTIAVDEHLPRLPELLVPLLEHIQSAGVAAEAITLVCQPPSTGQPWALELPDEFQDMQVEVHQPGERRKLSYLATTRQGRRIYLNRSAVDADQLILLTGRGYDPCVGISGAETMLFPGLSDQATLNEFAEKLSLDVPGDRPWPIQAEAVEVAWLLGAPFLVQVIEGGGGDILHVLGGTVESSSEGKRLMEERWRIHVERAADIVVAGISGDGQHATFTDLARAFYSAARVVKPGCRVVLLTDALPKLGRSAEVLRQHDDPMAALRTLLKEKPADLAEGFLWSSAAHKVKLYLLSRLPGDVVEEMFATPLEGPGQVSQLIDSDATCLILPDAHKALAVLANSG
jgi:nickel-dependent lactate racemase